MDRVSTADPPPPDNADLRGLARSLRELFEIGVRTLAADEGPSELALRVTSHLGCELTEIVLVTERFPKWEHVNVQRGVDAYLAARPSGMDQEEAGWFGPPGGAHHPHENLLSVISTPGQFGGGFRIAGPRGIRVAPGGRTGAGAGPPATAPRRSARMRTPRWWSWAWWRRPPRTAPRW